MRLHRLIELVEHNTAIFLAVIESFNEMENHMTPAQLTALQDAVAANATASTACAARVAAFQAASTAPTPEIDAAVAAVTTSTTLLNSIDPAALVIPVPPAPAA